ncbi:MAG: helix-turn-helix domain-containing protein [Rhodobacteraceae bacterium]|nr:helix-turn-helix domain-containing protein [Paracoccaceae bacterium]
MTANLSPLDRLPDWVPSAVRLYLNHTEGGLSLREIARAEGVHASTVLRQVRRFENRRDDPLVDGALGRLKQNEEVLTADSAAESALHAEARRVLPRLAEPGALLAVAPDMDRAVVLREGGAGNARLAVLDRLVAEAFALQEWIACVQTGRVLRYEITAAGRTALRRLTGQDDATAVAAARGRDEDEARRTRPVTVESPVTALARRRDKDGKPFLTPDLVAAAERLREDFEAAQAGTQASARTAQDWDRLLTGPSRATGGGRGPSTGYGASGARDRVRAALDDLGPGLADMALRCCCYMEGLETAERRLGWSARSGKIVLRIALLRLMRHYEELGEGGKMMG